MYKNNYKIAFEYMIIKEIVITMMIVFLEM